MATATGTPAALLDAVRAHEQTIRAGEVAKLCAALDWAIAHEVDRLEEAAFSDGFGEQGLTLGGPGAPLVAESAVAELALALGVSSDAGGRYLGDALEIRYRLPRLWERVVSGRCPVWRARRVAQATVALCEDGADHVDRHVAVFAHTVSWAQLDRLVTEALLRWEPEVAEERRRAAAEDRHVDVRLDQAGPSGTVTVEGSLDVADALDLETALADRAAELRLLGSEDSLPVRRSMALGDLARAHAMLDLEQASAAVSGEEGPRAVRCRRVVLHVHLSAQAVAGPATDDHGVGRLGNTRGPVTAEQVRAWCGAAGTVTVRPVLDLAGDAHTHAYEVPDRVREQIGQRDLHCVFPHCTRPAERCDAEHVIAWPAGPTASSNLAPVCRRHHRHKTHHGWTYEVLVPGSYLWTSAVGLRYLRMPSGTHDLNPPPRRREAPALDSLDPPDPSSPGPPPRPRVSSLLAGAPPGVVVDDDPPPF